MRWLGVPLDLPQSLAERAVSDLGSVARAARSAPAQLDRLLTLGEEIVATGQGVLALGEDLVLIGRGMLEVGERIDRRAEALMELGDRLDARADEMLALGGVMGELGERMYTRGGEIVDQADQVVQTGSDLVTALPTLERALDLATPLEGAIDRVGRLVDRLPGGAGARRPGSRLPGRSTLPEGQQDHQDHPVDPGPPPPRG